MCHSLSRFSSGAIYLSTWLATLRTDAEQEDNIHAVSTLKHPPLVVSSIGPIGATSVFWR
jgi:hypothetical protein